MAGQTSREDPGTLETRGLSGSLRPPAADADASFDALVLDKWRLHLELLSREGHKLRVWGSTYWREWMEAIDLCDDPACADDVCVADVDDEVDGDGDIDVKFMCGICNESDSDPINHAPRCLL